MERDDLIRKFESGKCTPQEVERIEQLILSGEVDPMEISVVDEMKDQLDNMQLPDPGIRLEDGFYAMLAKEKRKLRKTSVGWTLSLDFLKTGWGLAAYSITLLLIGFLVFNNRSDNSELVSELRDMKELMMLNLIEGESSSDRLKAVSMSTGLDGASDKVILALLETLNNDENDNVRLAALEALLMYSNRPEVRQGLVESISKQESPMVQISLAEVMLSLQEKSSIEDLRELLNREETPIEVKEKVRETIESLI